MSEPAVVRDYAQLQALVKDAAFTSVDGQRYKAGWWWGLMTVTATRKS